MILNPHPISHIFTCPRNVNMFFILNPTKSSEIYPLSLHDALPIYTRVAREVVSHLVLEFPGLLIQGDDATVVGQDRKSTRLNSSHVRISYAVFCLKKKSMIFNPQPISPIFTCPITSHRSFLLTPIH